MSIQLPTDELKRQLNELLELVQQHPELDAIHQADIDRLVNELINRGVEDVL